MFNTLSGGVTVYTNGERIGITSKSAPMSYVGALQHIENFDVTCALRTTSFWTGKTTSPYQNNDCYLSEVFNDIQSDSLNRSWAGSFCNAYNNIPEGVTDSGTRVGIIGWATSVYHAAKDYKHEGTLAQQTGVKGVAGFQSTGSGSSAIVQKAVGVYGVIYTDSEGSTVEDATAGRFSTIAGIGSIQKNVAVLAEAAGGRDSNYSFFGRAGVFFNADPVIVGNGSGQSSASVCARNPGNAFEFGHPDGNGYANNLGTTQPHGFPFLAFCAEADPDGDTFTTRGNSGSVISSDLTGSIVFGRVPNAAAVGQAVIENGRFNSDGNLLLHERPILAKKPPSSSKADGAAGEMSWDEDHVYVCVAPNKWKRAALQDW